MARTKHRKAHKQALARWKSVHAPQLPKAGVPIQVAKNAYEVRYPTEEVAAAITVNGKTLEGHVDTARGAIPLPDNLTVEKGDRIRMDHTYRLVANPGAVRGRTEHLMTFDDAAHWPGAGRQTGKQEMLRNLNYAELELRALAHLEMAGHKDENGKPVFDEISLCPGPDPNGLTTL